MTPHLFDAQAFLDALRLGGAPAEAAALKLMRHYKPFLRAKLLVAGVSHNELDDLISELLFQVISGAPLVRSAAAFHSWLCIITKHEVAAHWARRSRERAVFSEPPAPDPALQDTLQLLDQMPDDSASDPVLRLCLQGQLAKFRRDAAQRYACIELIAMGHEAREIAELIGRSYGAAREYMSRCCAALLDYWRPCLSAGQAQALKRSSAGQAGVKP